MIYNRFPAKKESPYADMKHFEKIDMPQIIPIKDLRDTTRISEMCHSTNDLIYVTKNGYGDMVVMSMSSYENMFGRMQVHDSVMLASEQVNAGIFTDGVSEFAGLDKKYEL